MIKQIYVVLVIITLSSCITSSVFFDVKVPADITIGQDIKNIVVVNRSRPNKDNLAVNIAEGLSSGEDIGADRKGAEYCVQGLFEILNESDRFSLKNAGEIQLKETGTSTFPVPLAWNEVKSICGSYDGDALLVLETFDLNSSFILGSPVTRITKVKKNKIKQLSYPTTLVMEVKSGWRIYDANDNKIIDEKIYIDIKEFNSWGSTIEESRENLPPKRIAINKSGKYSGNKFGSRISPIWLKMNRTYYIGKHRDFKNAKQYVKKGDWDTAIEIWLSLTDNDDLKIANRAEYNMAVASEIKGGLEIAIDWAKRSRRNGNKKANNYINVLNSRVIDKEKLKQQLN
tara:strand:+ start:4813 stop:5841 length:1029 start_codon:yes stop_codon:yes gene_type:complete